MTHSRAAQAKRSPRPITSGSNAAATSSQTTGDRAAGPTAKRTMSPQPGALEDALGRPKMETDARPAHAVPITHGAKSASATRRDPIVATNSPRTASRAPTSNPPTVQESAAISTTGRTAGAKPVATAMTAPSSAICPADASANAGPAPPRREAGHLPAPAATP